MDMNKILATKESKLNFLKGLIRLSKSDGITDKSEKDFFHQAAVSMGLEEQECRKLDMIWKQEKDTIMISFETTIEKMFFFVQAIQLCWIDESYTEDEKKEIQLLAKELGISEEAIRSVEAWVAEGIEWNKKGDKLLFLS